MTNGVQYTFQYQVALTEVGLGWKRGRGETDEALFVEFPKASSSESYTYWNPADQVEAKELLNEDEKINPSQAPKVRARLRQRLLEE